MNVINTTFITEHKKKWAWINNTDKHHQISFTHQHNQYKSTTNYATQRNISTKYQAVPQSGSTTTKLRILCHTFNCISIGNMQLF